MREPCHFNGSDNYTDTFHEGYYVGARTFADIPMTPQIKCYALNIIITYASILLFYVQSALATEAILTTVPNASVVGRGVLTYIFWDVYRATLYAPNGRWDPAQPYALSLEYYRELVGKDIADCSVQEIRKQGFTDEVKLATWNAQLKAIFPDVKDGSVLSAIYLPGKETVFYSGDNEIGAIKGDDFGRLFFGRWLGEKTSAPELRRALLGLS